MIGGKRQGIAVWITSLKFAKQLRRFGNIHYISKKMKYVILYCKQEDVPEIVEKLRSFHFVRDVQPSMWPFLRTDFEQTKSDKEKEYDYKIGI